MGKVKQWSVEKKNEIKRILISMWTSLAMDIPDNYEEIVQFVYEDVCETADPEAWSTGDVAIGFRRWIEAQINPLKVMNVQPEKFEDAIHTVKDLKAFLNTLKDDDQVVLEIIDLETGDVEDLFPFHVDVIDGIELTDGRVVSEIRFCQEPNTTEKYKRLSPEVLRKIDWTELRGQKTVLLKLIDEIEKHNENPTVGLVVPRETVEPLDGILNLIDALQDYAVDEMGISSMLVFDFEEEDNREK